MGEETSLQAQLQLTLKMLQENMTRNEETIKLILEENRELRTEIRGLRDKVENPKDRLKSEVIRKFNRKRRDLIKNKLIETIHSRSSLLPELKEIIVDDFEYCSKATFYRYIQEMTKEGIIQVVGTRIVLAQNA